MSELQACTQTRIEELLRCSGVLLPNDYTPTWSYERGLKELAALIVEVVHPRITTVDELAESIPGTVIHIGDGPGGIYEKDRAGSWGYDAWGDEETAILIDSDTEGDVIRVLYTPAYTPTGLDEFHTDTTMNPGGGR